MYIGNKENAQMDFEIIAERKPRERGKKMERVVLFDVLPKIYDVETVSKIIRSGTPIQTYLDELEKQSGNEKYVEKRVNRNYEVIGQKITFPIRDKILEIKRKVSSYEKNGWTVRLVW
jgi:hypothetical protein